MAGFAITPERWDAGQRYIEALRRLGLHPETALWIYDTEDDEYRLVLVSELVRLKGSVAVYTLLHMAYEKSGTPDDLDPWVVEVMDDRHPLVGDFRRALASPPRDITVDYVEMDGTKHVGEQPQPLFNFATFLFGPTWVYFESDRKAHISAQQQWKRFSQNVERLAA